MRYRVVDVFADRPLAGNALCVVFDPAESDEQMSAIAKEANLSETTFVTSLERDPEGGGSYSMRIMTPGGELPFAGHPSLGTAWALGPGTWVQTTPGAVVTIEVDVDGRGATMGQPDPALSEVDPAGITEALGVPGVEGVWHAEVGGMTHLLVPTEVPMAEVRPDLAAIARVSRSLGANSLAPFRRLSDRELHARVFLPATGIAEDPGTGSAAGPFGVLARKLWGTETDITIRQGEEMGRPCRVEVHAVEGEIRVGGRVVAAAEGRWLV